MRDVEPSIGAREKMEVARPSRKGGRVAISDKKPRHARSFLD
jgi:hypothetical protein